MQEKEEEFIEIYRDELMKNKKITDRARRFKIPKRRNKYKYGR